MPVAPNYSVPALEKGLDILEVLAADAVPQSLGELGARLKRSSSELFRMLNCLERRGYLSRDEASGKYALTLKLYSLAHAHSAVEKLLRAARLPMQVFTEKFRESCHLSVLEGDRLLLVAQQESPEPIRLSIEVGGVFDPLATASGRLLLAHLSETELATVLAGRIKGRALTDFKHSLAGIRKRGLSTAESETIEGVHDLSVVVGSPESGVTAALAVTRLQRRGQRQDETALVAGMRSTTAEITRALGLAST